MTTPDDCRFNLLDEPLLHWRGADRVRVAATLPGLLAALGAGKVADFPRVRAHQYHPWCMFLAQLAALGLQKAGQTNPAAPEGEWRELLLGLTDGAVEPWCLVVEDLEKPAFMQPPVQRSSSVEWQDAQSIDLLDLTSTVAAKEHDVKSGVVRSDDFELAMHALVTLQTMQGYTGRSNYGVARMNGGSASRCRVSTGASQEPSAFFAAEVAVMLEGFAIALTGSFPFSDNGHRLLWLVPWDGTVMLPLSVCAPHFIEICRRARLFGDGELTARYVPTKNPRMLAAKKTGNKEFRKGDVGDPWIPVSADGAAFNVGRTGFTYQKTAELLWGAWKRPAAAQVRAGRTDEVTWVAAAMARGQGKTAGLHERTMQLDARKRRLMAEHADTLASVAAKRVSLTATVNKDVLRPALKKLACGGDVPDIWFNALDKAVDRVFFDALFEDFDLEERARNIRWEERLYDIAKGILRDAQDGMPIPDARRLRATAKADSMFEWRARDKLQDFFASRSQPHAAEEPNP